MGTKVAPSYANIFMEYLENKLLQNAIVKPALYLHYIDDLFCIFDQGEEKVKEFKKYMNELHLTIKFTIEY